MKEIKALIRPHMLTKVMESLHALPHFPGVTVSDCQGQGRGQGSGGRFQATEDTIYFVKMTKLELFCADEAADEFVEAIRKAAHTGLPDDGLIAVTDLSRLVSIRTGDEGEKAV